MFEFSWVATTTSSRSAVLMNVLDFKIVFYSRYQNFLLFQKIKHKLQRNKKIFCKFCINNFVDYSEST